MNWLMVIAGAVVGAPLRYLMDRAVQARLGTVFPWGTFAVNLTACTVLGLLTGVTAAAAVPDALQHLIGPGLCATLSTYSTFSFETVRLSETGAKLLAAAYAIGSVVAGLTAAFLAGHAAVALLGHTAG
ncbi:fluoride efflux transporter FluC [Dactylosporangium siamense]|uniref:Fluoride-specific ion channel FluC n=1 Tax=Dactylosporangium siamense TaxID=685454 RepID=A0A919UDI2_9ACTN|nr:CrcB family protein [Dactylosporangium siamense]GIG47936.1 putative fluoride ion transporter CrcB 2 [Dactylosporangium siamense]